MENIRKHVNVELVSNKNRSRKLYCDPAFQRVKEFPETDMVAVHMKKTAIVHSKPIYLGMSILVISKTWMYRFYYKYLKPKYGDGVSLVYTDTDSLILRIETEDLYKDIQNDIPEWFDTSEFPADHP